MSGRDRPRGWPGFFVREVLEEHRRGVEMVDRDVEEALDLLAVQVHRQHAVGAGGHEEVGHQLGGDGHARLVLAVLARVAVERHDGGDALRRRPPGGVDHDEQLHQMMVGRRAGRLDDEDVRAADVLVDLHERLAVGEAGHGRLPERHADGLADFLRQRPVGISGEDLQPRVAHKVAAILRSGGRLFCGEIGREDFVSHRVACCFHGASTRWKSSGRRCLSTAMRRSSM